MIRSHALSFLVRLSRESATISDAVDAVSTLNSIYPCSLCFIGSQHHDNIKVNVVKDTAYTSSKTRLPYVLPDFEFKFKPKSSAP